MARQGSNLPLDLGSDLLLHCTLCTALASHLTAVHSILVRSVHQLWWAKWSEVAYLEVGNIWKGGEGGVASGEYFWKSTAYTLRWAILPSIKVET